jgi:hypothetical protein
MSINRILLGAIICFAFASCYKALYTKAYLIGEPPKKTEQIASEKIIKNINGWDVKVGLWGVMGNPSHEVAKRDSFSLGIVCVPISTQQGSMTIQIDSVMIHLLHSDLIICPIKYSHYKVKETESTEYEYIYIGPDEPKIELTVVVTVTFPSGEKRTERKTVTMKRYERVEHGWIVD